MSSGVPGVPRVPSSGPRGSGHIPPPYGRLPQPQRRVGLWVLAGCGGATLLTLLVALLGYGLVRLGLGLVTEQIKQDLSANGVIIDHLGRLENLEMKFTESMMAAGDDEYVFRATGTKGTGIVRATCVTVDADTEKVTSGTLQLESGETVDLFPVLPGS